MLTVRTLYGFVFLINFLCATWTGILYISGFATYSNLVSSLFHSNLQANICPPLKTLQIKSHISALYSNKATFLFSCMFVVVWSGKFGLPELAWPALFI